ncbi:hypothetical protein BJ508DRAFT_327111 [Ascobolus immersus RN42]|uniref:F-box domain-containing protein n=1 Tax=Ascobolus immersus RN42 TaxID=1160509 RepID=A0A3N4I3U1_ASCIM|nr:hypothetical protein BJ508DRAFT_327111 [Ascobolus immersus RN42]
MQNGVEPRSVTRGGGDTTPPMKVTPKRPQPQARSSTLHHSEKCKVTRPYRKSRNPHQKGHLGKESQAQALNAADRNSGAIWAVDGASNNQTLGAQHTPILQVPNEILHTIVTYLSDFYDFTNLSMVNRRFYALTQTEYTQNQFVKQWFAGNIDRGSDRADLLEFSFNKASPASRQPPRPPQITRLQHNHHQQTSPFSVVSHSDSLASRFSTINAIDAELTISEEQVRKIKQFCRSFVYNWLENASKCLDIHIDHNASHFKYFIELETRCKNLYAEYLEFMGLKGEAVGNSLLESQLFSVDFFLLWRNLFRMPRSSGEGARMKRLRDVCDGLVAKLVSFRNSAEDELRRVDDETCDALEKPRSIKAPDYITNVEIPMRFAARPLEDTPLDDQLSYMGLEPSRCFNLGEEGQVGGRSALGVLLDIAKKESDLCSFDTPSEYGQAAGQFGMNAHFCSAISDPEYFPLVSSKPLSQWLEWAAQGRFCTLQKELAVITESRAHGGYGSDDADHMPHDDNDEDDGEGDSEGGRSEDQNEEDEDDTPFYELAKRDREDNPGAYREIYRGGWVAVLEKFPAELTESSEGRNNTLSLLPPSHMVHKFKPTDFSRGPAAIHFTSDKGLARQYAKLARRFYATPELSSDKVGILCLWVDKKEIGKKVTILKLDDFICYNRVSIDKRPPTKAIKELCDVTKSPLLIGPTAGSEKKASKSKNWKDISPITLGEGVPKGTSIEQVVFRGTDVFYILDNAEAYVESI